MQNALVDVKSGTIAGEFTYGIKDDEGTIHRSYVFREMTGEEEDLLAGKGNVMARLDKVIVNCAESFGPLVDKQSIARSVSTMTAIDRMVSLIAIRRATLGDDYPVRVGCPSCSATSDFNIDLGGLAITQASSETDKFEDELPSGKVVCWHLMDGKDESWLQSQTKRGKDVITLAMLARVDSVDGEELDRRNDLKGSLELLKKLRMSERSHIRSLFKDKEGSIDTMIEFTCSSCSHEWKSEMEVGQEGFFFPQGI